MRIDRTLEIRPNVSVASSKARLPETLPEFPAVGTPSEFEALELIDASFGEAVQRELSLADEPGDEGESGVQPVHQAWDDVHRQMQAAFTMGDYEYGLMLAERYLKIDPADSVAQLCLDECRVMVEAQLADLLSPLDRVITLTLPLDQLGKAHLDLRSMFLLSRVDGALTIEDVLDISGMPRVDALRYIADWVQQGYVSLG
jgi:hypothetical protein